MRGVNLPGVNFYPENYHLISNLTQQAYELSFHQPATASLLPFYYEPPLGWKVCNDDIVSRHCSEGYHLFSFIILMFRIQK